MIIFMMGANYFLSVAQFYLVIALQSELTFATLLISIYTSTGNLPFNCLRMSACCGLRILNPLLSYRSSEGYIMWTIIIIAIAVVLHYMISLPLVGICNIYHIELLLTTWTKLLEIFLQLWLRTATHDVKVEVGKIEWNWTIFPKVSHHCVEIVETHIWLMVILKQLLSEIHR
jgi:hypothetical protein